MILGGHVPFYREILSIPGLVGDPILCFGFQEFEPGATLDGANHEDLGAYFAKLGITTLSLDLFDPRAALRYDMNAAVPANEHDRYATLIDIGSLEHVFDSRQCFENCLRMVRVGGHYLLHTPVNGYYAHGFHVFNPEALRSGFLENGFRLIYEKYSTIDGQPLSDPSAPGDNLGWFVARKEHGFETFTCPQQRKWFTRYAGADSCK